MGAEEVTQVEGWARLADKYGVALILAIVLMVVLLYIVRMLVRGDLVPRHLLDRAEEDRDRLQDVLDKERAAFMSPTLEVLQKLKIDHNEDRGK